MAECLTADSQPTAPVRLPTLFVVVLNWNGWQYTLPCLESVLQSDYPRLRVIVCDNGSSDDSLSVIRSWADGQLAAPRPSHPKLDSLLPKTRRSDLCVAFVDEAECLGEAAYASADVICVCRKSNGGYAAGNNAGLRLASQLGADYVWILNNDTLVEPSAAAHLVNHMHANARIGLCGTTIRFYDDPDRIHILGGWHFNKWTAKPTPVSSPTPGLKGLSYIDGSSVCVSRKLLEDVGLLSLEYFLFCEELDWATRARGRFDLGYCESAVVYHKGAGSQMSGLKSFREYYGTRARILITRKFWPTFVLTVLPVMLFRVLLRMLTGQPAAARSILLATFGRPYPGS